MRYVILGRGGHARCVLDSLRRVIALMRVGGDEYEIGDATDAHATAEDAVPFRLVGTDDDLVPSDDLLLVNGLGRLEVRKEIYEKMIGRGFAFAVAVDPTAVVAADVRLHPGCYVGPGAVVRPGCEVGENTLIDGHAFLDHDVRVGAHCHIAPGAVLSGHATVGSGVLVGVGARVLPGVHVGQGAVVGAGAVVTKSVPDFATAVGIPARVLPMKELRGASIQSTPLSWQEMDLG